MTFFTSKRSRALVGIIAVLLVVAFLVPIAGCKKDTAKGKNLRVAFSAAPDAIDATTVAPRRSRLFWPARPTSRPTRLRTSVTPT